MSDLNGGSPSRNGTAPEADAEVTGPRVTLLVADRLDALERTLGTVRRRGMCLKIHSLVRREDRLQLVFRAAPEAVIPERWIAELAALVDVDEVEVAGVASAPH